MPMGYFLVMGRVDDVISVSGQPAGFDGDRIALVSHPAVAEAAVVGRPTILKGEGHRPLRTCRRSQPATEPDGELRQHVGAERPDCPPDEIRFSEPCQTRTAKSMRRIIRPLAAGER